MPFTHVYEHPEGHGLGRHHAGEDLSSRPAQPPEAAAALRAAMEVMDPTDEQRAKMDAQLSQTMADLDMHHGTPVEVIHTNEATGDVIVSWTDQTGTPRNTSLTPQVFAQFFREV